MKLLKIFLLSVVFTLLSFTATAQFNTTWITVSTWTSPFGKSLPRNSFVYCIDSSKAYVLDTNALGTRYLGNTTNHVFAPYGYAASGSNFLGYGQIAAVQNDSTTTIFNDPNEVLTYPDSTKFYFGDGDYTFTVNLALMPTGCVFDFGNATIRKSGTALFDFQAANRIDSVTILGNSIIVVDSGIVWQKQYQSATDLDSLYDYEIHARKVILNKGKAFYLGMYKNVVLDYEASTTAEGGWFVYSNVVSGTYYSKNEFTGYVDLDTKRGWINSGPRGGVRIWSNCNLKTRQGSYFQNEHSAEFTFSYKTGRGLGWFDIAGTFVGDSVNMGQIPAAPPCTAENSIGGNALEIEGPPDGNISACSILGNFNLLTCGSSSVNANIWYSQIRLNGTGNLTLDGERYRCAFVIEHTNTVTINGSDNINSEWKMVRYPSQHFQPADEKKALVYLKGWADAGEYWNSEEDTTNDRMLIWNSNVTVTTNSSTTHPPYLLYSDAATTTNAYRVEWNGNTYIKDGNGCYGNDSIFPRFKVAKSYYGYPVELTLNGKVFQNSSKNSSTPIVELDGGTFQLNSGGSIYNKSRAATASIIYCETNNSTFISNGGSLIALNQQPVISGDCGDTLLWDNRNDVYCSWDTSNLAIEMIRLNSAGGELVYLESYTKSGSKYYNCDPLAPFINLDPDLFLIATRGITKDGSDYVSLWEDSGAEGKDATQGTGSMQPLWVDAQTPSGDPIIRFASGDGMSLSSATASTYNMTLYFVVKQASGGDFRMFGKSGGYNTNLFLNGGGKTYWDDGGTCEASQPSSTGNLEAWTVGIAKVSNPGGGWQMSVKLNGVTYTTVLGACYPTGVVMDVIMYATSGYYSACDVYLLAKIDRVTTGAEDTQCEALMKTLSGISY